MAKIIVLGNSAVGKTSILNRYTWNGQSVYNLSHTSTIGVDFKAKTIDIGDASMKLQLWDTAGQ
jgi:small GTP-binding protein